jgi:signal transduction histidine kinase
MRERVKQLGGVLDIQSEPGRGTTINVELPLSQGARTGDETQNETLRRRKTSTTSKPAPNRG